MTQFLTLLGTILTWLFAVAIVVWLLWRSLKRTEDERLISKWLLTAALLPMIWLSLKAGLAGPILAPLFGVILALTWAPNIASLLVSPLTNALDGGAEAAEPEPLYSIAEANRKKGKYQEAVAEIQKQLARFPKDFQSHLMLAQIQAEDLKDLPSAQSTLEGFLAQPDHAPTNVAHALNRLADWQLRFARDPAAARLFLERILDACPGTEFAQLAAERIAHLASPEMLAEQSNPRAIPLHHLAENIGLRDDFTSLKPLEADPMAEAEKHVKHLEEYPLDSEAREKLALIYAESYQRPDLAAEQFEQLIGNPSQPAKHVARWLNLLADLHVKGGEVASARLALERIMDRFPNTAAAEQARNRISYLGIEMKGRQQSQVLKLGAYDQNIGLKKDWPT